MASKTLTLVLSFVAGIVAIIVLFHPLILLRLPIEALFGMIFQSSVDTNLAMNLVSILIVYFAVFFSLGLIANKLFSRKFKDVSPYFTIPFTLPIVFVLEFMYFFETGGARAYELFATFVAGLSPMVFYIAGIYFASRK